MNLACTNYALLKKKPQVTCETLDSLVWYYAGVRFKKICSRYNVSLDVEEVKNSFLRKNAQFPEKRAQMIQECKQKCQENRACIENMSGKGRVGKLEKRLKDKASCEGFRDFIESLKKK